MKLITKAIRAKLPKLYATEHDSDPVVHLKLFTPWTSWTWFITELDDDEDIAFGYAHNGAAPNSAELGYTSLEELRDVTGPGGLRIERDLHWVPRPLSEAKTTL
jgi:hypothetical protein